MNKNIFGKVLVKGLLSAAFVCVMLGQQSCLDEYAPGNYYTFEGETVASFLENDPDARFTNFITTLKRTGLWGELSSYGEYTCFAPTNEFFDEYLSSKNVSSVDELTDAQCDTVAKTHIIEHLFYCKDLSTGALPYPNMLDRYLVYEADSAEVDGRLVLINRLNGSKILEKDDSVQNGVVHIIEKVLSPSNKFLSDVMAEDPTISIFTEALRLTKMDDSLALYVDMNYSISTDSVVISSDHKYGTSTETDYWRFPEKRVFKFTAFVEPDDVMQQNGISNIDELITFAKTAYAPNNENYQAGTLTDADVKKGLWNDEDWSHQYYDPAVKQMVTVSLPCYTQRSHPLNKFVSYHLLPEELFYNTFNIVTYEDNKDFEKNFVQWNAIDVEDFYETMMPHSVMRISTPVNKLKYINRKGASGDQFGGKNMIPGVRIREMKGDSFTGINGVYHYIDNMLVYDKKTREEALNCRMRVMCSTLSPDFINSGARGRYYASQSGGQTFGFKKGFCKNVERTEQTQAWVRYVYDIFTVFRSDEITIRGLYDISFKLPPVPTSGVYELRFFLCSLTDNANQKSDRGVVQIYLGTEDEETGKITYKGCGIPVNLAINPKDPSIGNMTAQEIQSATEEMSDEEKEEFLSALEKSMHNRGYMRGMDSYSGNSGTYQDPLSGRADCVRKILTTDEFSSEKNYWFRIRLVSNDPTGVCSFNCVELCPKSVFKNEKYPEDRH